MRLFIFGAGYSGRAIAREMSGSVRWIVGTTRNAENFPALEKAHIDPILFAGTREDALNLPLEYMTHMVVSIGPDGDGDPVLNHAADIIRDSMPALSWIGYLSTVGVYGDHDGAWVDEETGCKPVSKRSVQRKAAEEAWTRFGDETGLPVAILRLSGIYGPGRNAFVNLEWGTAKRLVKPGQVFNRIHVDDIAGATAHLLRARASGIFNVTDDEPAPPQDVVAFAAALMGVEAPPETDFATAELTPMARSFYGENKRVSNAKLRQSGYSLRHPDYRAALSAMWADGSWRG